MVGIRGGKPCREAVGLLDLLPGVGSDKHGTSSSVLSCERYATVFAHLGLCFVLREIIETEFLILARNDILVSLGNSVSSLTTRFFFVFFLLQTNVSADEISSVGTRCKSQVHTVTGYRGGGRLPVQVSQ